MSGLNQHGHALEVCPLPAFLTGTSTEYLGERPLPHVVRERPVVFVLGPVGVGKSVVAARLARGDVEVLDRSAVQDACLERVRHGAWPVEVLACDTLVLDGPVWLQNRPAIVGLLSSLLQERVRRGRRTIVCQADTDGSVHLLMEQVAVGHSATIALRFPTSRRARVRAAERICLEHGIPLRCARATASTPDWSYAAVLERIRGPFFTLR